MDENGDGMIIGVLPGFDFVSPNLDSTKQFK